MHPDNFRNWKLLQVTKLRAFLCHLYKDGSLGTAHREAYTTCRNTYWLQQIGLHRGHPTPIGEFRSLPGVSIYAAQRIVTMCMSGLYGGACHTVYVVRPKIGCARVRTPTHAHKEIVSVFCTFMPAFISWKYEKNSFISDYFPEKILKMLFFVYLFRLRTYWYMR